MAISAIKHTKAELRDGVIGALAVRPSCVLPCCNGASRRVATRKKPAVPVPCRADPSSWCSRHTAILVEWMTYASIPRTGSQRASQKPSPPASLATRTCLISRQPGRLRCANNAKASGYWQQPITVSEPSPWLKQNQAGGLHVQ